MKDLDPSTGIVTVARVVVALRSANTPRDGRFQIKEYPKDGEWRQVKLAGHVVAKLVKHIADGHLGPDDLIFRMPETTGPSRRRRPEVLPDPLTLGFTEPNEKGRRYRHGTMTAYQTAKCRCDSCRDAVAAYRAQRRAAGKDAPRRRRQWETDGHIPNDWFRVNVWDPALRKAGLGFHMTPHGMRHAHASWLLAGGADLQVVKERLGHGSITTTERYLHTLPGHHDAALAALATIRGDRSVTPSKASLASAPAETHQHGDETDELRALVTKLTAVLSERDTLT